MNGLGLRVEQINVASGRWWDCAAAASGSTLVAPYLLRHFGHRGGAKTSAAKTSRPKMQ
jgi:hypothetical protein